MFIIYRRLTSCFKSISVNGILGQTRLSSIAIIYIGRSYAIRILQVSIDRITVKPLNSGHLRVLKNLSIIERCPQLGGNFKKIVTFETKRFVRYSWHARCLGCPLLGGFTVSLFLEKEKIVNLLYDLYMFLLFCYILGQEESFNSLNCVLILYKHHCVGFHILLRCN